MKKKRFMIPIGFKLITIISLIVILSLTSMTFLATYFFRDDSEVRIRENSLKLASIIALKVESDFNSLQEKALLIASSLMKEKKVEEDNEWSSFINDIIFNEAEDIVFIGVAEKTQNGLKIDRGIVNPGFIESGKSLSLEDITSIAEKESVSFSKSFDGGFEVHNSTPYFSEPVFGMSLPLEKEIRKSSGPVVIVYVKMKCFLKAISSDDIYRTFIVNNEGSIIAHYDRELVEAQANLMDLDIVSMMIRSPLGNGQVHYKDRNGVAYLGSFRKIEGKEAGVISTVQMEKAFEAVDKIQTQNILITVLVLNFAIFIVYFFAKTMSSPVKKLVSAAREIENGNFEVKLSASTRDEIGLLTDAFREMGKGLAEREKMKEAFGKFVNKEIAEMAMKDEIKLGGEKKVAAVFFSDIRSFTSISENLEPEEVVEFLNEYMTIMVNCVNETGGVVDKFIGDAIMALWGTPISHGNDTENAIDGALMMRKVLIDFNKYRGTSRKPVIRIGCGINTGPVLAGQIGSHDRMEYTVIGDAVNLASRIESLNKPFGTDILITEDSYALVKNIFHVEAMKKITVKGKKEPQQVYAVLGRKDDPGRPRSLAALRQFVGINEKDIMEIDPDKEEKKYEIVD